jgi:hypothetical protein
MYLGAFVSESVEASAGHVSIASKIKLALENGEMHVNLVDSANCLF